MRKPGSGLSPQMPGFFHSPRLLRGSFLGSSFANDSRWRRLINRSDATPLERRQPDYLSAQ
jgi:hypothetical protein